MTDSSSWRYNSFTTASISRIPGIRLGELPDEFNALCRHEVEGSFEVADSKEVDIGVFRLVL